MIKVCYSEMDGPEGFASRIDVRGHAGYAPAGQDIVCAGASTLMQALVYALAGEDGVQSDVWEEPEGPRLCVSAAAPVGPETAGAFELVKAGFALLAERYPEHVRFADTSRRGERGMMDLQLFAEGGDGGEGAAESAPPALSRAQQQQAAAAGTLGAKQEKAPAATAKTEAKAETEPKREQPPAKQPSRPKAPPLPPRQLDAVRSLHARWAAEEAMLRRGQPDFSLREELKNPEMRRLMRLPGMRMQDAYRLAHYGEEMQRTARAVEQGVMERVRQRAARPAENGAHPGGAAVSRPDVASMTRAQREALERQALHGREIKF